MNVLFLGPAANELFDFFLRKRCRVDNHQGPLDNGYFQSRHYDFIISYRYRHIISKEVIQKFPGKLLNLHISLLPWNRGADPNLWSFLENTPKGVTIHYIDIGLDTGDILAQKELFFEPLREKTLATTYDVLNRELIQLFQKIWPDLVRGQAQRKPQPDGGSYHRSIDKKPYVRLLDRGWNTPVASLVGRAF